MSLRDVMSRLRNGALIDLILAPRTDGNIKRAARAELARRTPVDDHCNDEKQSEQTHVARIGTGRSRHRGVQRASKLRAS